MDEVYRPHGQDDIMNDLADQILEEKVLKSGNKSGNTFEHDNIIELAK